MSVDSAIQEDLYEGLSFVKQYFIEDTIQASPLFGTGLSSKFAPTTSGVMTDFMQTLYGGMTQFANAYANEINSDVDLSQLVLTRNVQQPSNQYAVWSGSDLTNNNDYYFTEVNLSKVLKDGKLLTALNNMRKVYSLLDPLVYNVYRAKIANPSYTASFKVQQYSVDTTNQTELEINNNVKMDQIKTCVNTVLRIPTDSGLIIDSDVVAIRRILRLHELMANINIALFLYNQNYSKQNSTFCLNLYNLCANTLLYANKTMTRDIKTNPSESVPDIALKLKQRANVYKEDTVAIDTLDTITADQRMTMRTENEKLENRRSKEQTSIRLMYATLVVTILTGLISLGAWFAPLEKTQKLAVIAIAFAVGLIVTVILHIVYNKQVEGFQDGTQNPSPTDTNLGVVTILNTIQSMQNAQFTQASDYVINTVQLAMMLTTFRTYGAINQMMLKERAFYTDRAVQMDNTNTKLTTASDALFLQQSIEKARIMFFISLMVVICLTVIALVAFPQTKNIILGVAAVLIFMMTFAYVMDTSGRVNTSGQKFYWSKPPTSTLA